MTVYELIQELTQYEPNAKIEFMLNGEIERNVELIEEESQRVDALIEIDDFLNVKTIDGTKHSVTIDLEF